MTMASSNEAEAVFYARIGDYSGFSQASDKETQEQWDYQVRDEQGNVKGKCRVRATARGESDNLEVQYTEVLKIPSGANGLQNNTEEPTVISKEYFEAWKRLFGTTGVFKIRYIFVTKNVLLKKNGEDIVLPELKYEVDVFLNKEGKRSKWCKIDIELDKVLEYLAEKHPEIKEYNLAVALTSLPIKLEDGFSAQNMDQEHKDAVDRLWKNFSVPLVQPQPEQSNAV